MKRYHIILLGIFFAVLIWSAVNPKDYFTWFLEVFPALIGIVVLGLTYKKFQLTDLTYTLIVIHAAILCVGGHYTYAEVPLFNDIRDWLGQDRNNYDKIGHLAQGFIPAVIARELLIRHQVVNHKKWLGFIIVCMCLALSAFYELIEWWVGASSGESAEAFLGTQGYVWDTQSDMFLALLGSVLALLLLSRFHDQQLKKIQK